MLNVEKVVAARIERMSTGMNCNGRLAGTMVEGLHPFPVDLTHPDQTGPLGRQSAMTGLAVGWKGDLPVHEYLWTRRFD